MSHTFWISLTMLQSSAMDFSETIEVKVVDKDHHSGYSIDSYFFAYFKSIDHALDQIRDVVRTNRLSSQEGAADDVVRDTTAARSPTHGQLHFMDHSQSMPEGIETRPSVLKSLLKPFSTTDATLLSPSSIPSVLRSRSTHDAASSMSGGVIVQPPSPSSRPHSDASSSTSTLQHQRARRPAGGPTGAKSLEGAEAARTITGAPMQLSPSASLSSHGEHTYPPSTRHSSIEIPALTSTSSWNFPPVATWLRNPSRLFSASSAQRGGGVIEVLSPSARSQDSSQEFGFSILESHDAGHDGVDPLIADKFRAYFALEEKESLMGCAWLPALELSRGR